MAKRKMKAMVKRKMKAMGKKKPKVPTKKKTGANEEAAEGVDEEVGYAGAFMARELSVAKRLVLLSGSNKSSSGDSRSAVFTSLSSSVNAPPVTARVMPHPAEDYLSDEELEDDS
uniref:Uncharacterized protein n=1 Tax=Oryza meridionalis TaxID=40149 RepID=A0A0E0EPG7_9ORYZ